MGEHEAGQCLFQVAHDPRCSKSGVYWSWNGGPREGRGAEALEKGGQISGGGGAGGGWDSIFENDQSSKVLSIEKAKKLFDTSTDITGAEWPTLKQITSPCPTLKVIGAVTQGMVKREELKRMREMGRPGMSDEDVEVMDKAIELAEAEEAAAAAAPAAAATTETPVVKTRPPAKFSKRQRVVMVADKTVGFVLGNTVGRVARLVGGKLLGKIPETAKNGSFHEEAPAEGSAATPSSIIATVDPEGMDLLEEAISVQLKEDSATVSASSSAAAVDTEDEALFQTLYDEETEKRMTPAE